MSNMTYAEAVKRAETWYEVYNEECDNDPANGEAAYLDAQALAVLTALAESEAGLRAENYALKADIAARKEIMADDFQQIHRLKLELLASRKLTGIAEQQTTRVIDERDALKAELERLKKELAGQKAEYAWLMGAWSDTFEHVEKWMNYSLKQRDENDALKTEILKLKTMNGHLSIKREYLLAEIEELQLQLKYPDPEDMPGELAAKYCPFNDPLHFHHDGCPSEWAQEERIEKAEVEAVRLVKENAALKAEVERLKEIQKSAQAEIGDLSKHLSERDAALAAARPLLDAAGKADPCIPCGPGERPLFTYEDESDILRAALAYREGKEKP